MATKSTKKSSARRPVKAKVTRLNIADTDKIRVVGDHNRREGSRYFTGYEMLRKTKTVGDFKAKYKPKSSETPRSILRDAIKDGYVKVGKVA